MQKIPTIFERDWDNDPSQVTPEVVPGCEWVLEGEGTPTKKYDGTCLMLDADGKWWARREVKDGKEAPPGFMSSGHDHKTLANVGWEPVEQSPWGKFLAEAVAGKYEYPPGTYELIGPKINRNPEGAAVSTVINHANAEVLGLLDRSYEGLKTFLGGLDIEGIVFKHPDGRMAKIKKRDFGLRR